MAWRHRLATQAVVAIFGAPSTIRDFLTDVSQNKDNYKDVQTVENGYYACKNQAMKQYLIMKLNLDVAKVHTCVWILRTVLLLFRSTHAYGKTALR